MPAHTLPIRPARRIPAVSLDGQSREITTNSVTEREIQKHPFTSTPKHPENENSTNSFTSTISKDNP